MVQGGKCTDLTGTIDKFASRFCTVLPILYEQLFLQVQNLALGGLNTWTKVPEGWDTDSDFRVTASPPEAQLPKCRES